MKIVAGSVHLIRKGVVLVLTVTRDGRAWVVPLCGRGGGARQQHRSDVLLSAFEAAECGLGGIIKRQPHAVCSEPFQLPLQKLKQRLGQCSPALLARVINAVTAEQRALAQESRMGFRAAA